MASEGLRLLDTVKETFDDLGQILEQAFCRLNHAWPPLAVTRLAETISSKKGTT
jgi:hypothetical protein